MMTFYRSKHFAVNYIYLVVWTVNLCNNYMTAYREVSTQNNINFPGGKKKTELDCQNFASLDQAGQRDLTQIRGT
jgi:hypothetical protein